MCRLLEDSNDRSDEVNLFCYQRVVRETMVIRSFYLCEIHVNILTLSYQYITMRPFCLCEINTSTFDIFTTRNISNNGIKVIFVFPYIGSFLLYSHYIYSECQVNISCYEMLTLEGYRLLWFCFFFLMAQPKRSWQYLHSGYCDEFLWNSTDKRPYCYQRVAIGMMVIRSFYLYATSLRTETTLTKITIWI